MERRTTDDDRAARMAEVRSELEVQLSPVRGDMSDEKFARALTLFSRDLMRSEHDRMRQPPSEMR
jgi:hypothetical protein